MKDKMKMIFDSRATWATIGAAVGAAFGEQAGMIANALGALVMAVL